MYENFSHDYFNDKYHFWFTKFLQITPHFLITITVPQEEGGDGGLNDLVVDPDG
jgi:hypothetical protein